MREAAGGGRDTDESTYDPAPGTGTTDMRRSQLVSLKRCQRHVADVVGFPVDLFYDAGGRSGLRPLKSDGALRTHALRNWECLALYYRRKTPAAAEAQQRPRVPDEAAAVSFSFNPPTVSVTGGVEQAVIDAVSRAVAATFAPALHQLAAYHPRRRVDRCELVYSERPQPHWRLTASNLDTDHVQQGLLFAAVLDAMHEAGGWVLKDAAACTSSVEMPR